jgi:hypothetical protein
MLCFIALCAIMLLACSSPKLDGTPSRPSTIGPLPDETADGSGRPDIPRTTTPTDMPTDPTYQNPTRPGMETRPTMPLPDARPVGIELALPIGETIGKRYPVITSTTFPLLRPRAVRATDSILVGYTQQLAFSFSDNSTGRVVFDIDDDTDEPDAYMEFVKRKPILEYRVRLEQGTFESLTGREISLLGDTYVIAEATNESVAFFGKSIASSLFFDDDHAIEVNGSRQSGTAVRVRPNEISYVLFADDDLLLSAGESLAEEVGWEKLASPRFDIRYDGIATQEETSVIIDADDDGFELTVELASGRTTIDIAERTSAGLILGTEKRPLRLTPCSGSAYCVRKDDTLLLTSPQGTTHIVRYDGKRDSWLGFTEGSNEYHVKFVGEPGKGATTQLQLGKDVFAVRVGPEDDDGEYTISIDQGFRSGRAELVLADQNIVRIGDSTGDEIPITIITPRTVNQSEQRLELTLLRSMRVRVEDVTMHEEDDGDDTVGQTGYGALITLARDDGQSDWPDNEGESATILVPSTQSYAIVTLLG